MSYVHVFCIFVFAPVQHNLLCFTWKGALEIHSLLLLLTEQACLRNNTVTVRMMMIVMTILLLLLLLMIMTMLMIIVLVTATRVIRVCPTANVKVKNNINNTWMRMVVMRMVVMMVVRMVVMMMVVRMVVMMVVRMVVMRMVVMMMLLPMVMMMLLILMMIKMTIILDLLQSHMVAEGVQPLMVFVNVKSGGCQGLDLITSFRKLLNPHQVFNLDIGGPLPG